MYLPLAILLQIKDIQSLWWFPTLCCVDPAQRMQPRSVAYEKTQSNRVSDFRDFVCSLFPKVILFDFYLPPIKLDQEKS